MSNGVKYSTTIPSGSLKKGNVALGITGELGPTSTTGFYNMPVPLSGRYIINRVSSSDVPNFFAPQDDVELIRFVKNEGATGGNTGSTAAALAWIGTQPNLLSTNKVYPDIVTDGLVLNLDAGFVGSYPTTASTWYDISGNNKNSSLINGPTFNNAGYITFDGVDDTTTFPIRTFNTGSPQQGTFNIRIKFPTLNTASQTVLFYDGGTSDNLIFLYRNANFGTNQYSWLIYYTGSIGSGFYLQGTTYLPGRWYDTTFTFNNTGTGSIYRNGELINSSAPTNGGSFISWRRTGNNSPGLNPASSAGTGSAQLFQWYNRPLTQQEILQNYYQAPIVTNGLVFAVDASNLVSYESGSTTAYSLTGSASGSLINGTGFTNNNGGAWNFDGVDDYITLGTQTLVTNDFSLNIWFNSTSNVAKEHFIISLGYSSNPSFLITQDTQNNGQSVLQAYYVANGITTGRTISTSTLPNTSIINLSFVRENGINTPYINGVPQTSRIFTENITLGSLTYVLGWAIPRNKASAYMQGNIYNCSIYNRALTATEVAQNFNAQCSKFGF